MLGVLGFTDHSQQHTVLVAERAGKLLKELGYDDHTIDLAMTAGFIHDIGNAINRHDHAHSGAILAYQLLREMRTEIGMSDADIITITGAIGQHDESTGTAIDPVSAALILADKSDVRKNRVRNKKPATFDAHDKVNFAALSTKLSVQKEKKIIQMDLELDDTRCSVMDYFEIFLERMIMCKKAADLLGYRFRLVANGSKIC
ncbi:MAG: HD domain-containing protein [Lachnospiraceae bacterium]|nr:HD domain-containing protein [Lachnospiraceae bacterium]